MTMQFIRRVCALIGSVATMIVVAGVHAQSPAMQDAEASNPAVDKFIDVLVFHAGMDGSVNAQISPLSPAPQMNVQKDAAADPADMFVEGKVGQAIVTGPYTLSYNLGDKQTLQQTGSMILWMSAAQGWDRSKNVPDYFFAMRLGTGNRNLMLARMGNPANKEAIYANIQADSKSTSVSSGSTRDWQAGEWHLLVANWGPNWVEFSLDGQQAVRRSLDQQIEPSQNNGARLTVSNIKTSNHFLLDELLVLSRPLDSEEIKWLYEQQPGRPVGNQ